MVSTTYQSNIVKYQIYSAISGFTVVGPLLNLFYLSADISYSQLSLIEIASLIVLVVLEVPTGLISDLLGRKTSIFLGCILMGAEFLLIASGFTFSIFIIAALLGGIGISLESGADQSLLYDSLKKLKKEHEFKKYLGRSSAIFKISAAVAGILWGYIYQHEQVLVFYFSGGMFIILGFFSLTMKETVTRKDTKVGNQNIVAKVDYVKECKSICLRSFCTMKNNKHLLVMLLFTGLVGTTIRAHTAIIRTPMLDDLLPNAEHLGFFLALGLGLSSLVNWYSYKLAKMFNERQVFFLIPLVMGCIYLLSGIFNHLSLIFLFFIIYLINAFQEVFISDYWHKHFSSRQRATLISFTGASQSFIGVFTLFGTGYLTDLLGLNQSSIVMGGCMLSMGLIFVLIFINTGAKKAKALPLNFLSLKHS